MAERKSLDKDLPRGALMGVWSRLAAKSSRLAGAARGDLRGIERRPAGTAPSPSFVST